MFLNEVVGGGANIFMALEEQRNHSERKHFSINDFVPFNGNKSPFLSHHKN